MIILLSNAFYVLEIQKKALSFFMGFKRPNLNSYNWRNIYLQTTNNFEINDNGAYDYCDVYKCAKKTNFILVPFSK